tara:strand:+ start:624 stop:881 length:258 start_codon:yes stop_codon:yes gene_type:complete
MKRKNYIPILFNFYYILFIKNRYEPFSLSSDIRLVTKEAIKDYLKSMKLNNERGNQFAYNKISIEYEELEDYKNAIKYINLSIKV